MFVEKTDVDIETVALNDAIDEREANDAVEFLELVGNAVDETVNVEDEVRETVSVEANVGDNMAEIEWAIVNELEPLCVREEFKEVVAEVVTLRVAELIVVNENNAVNVTKSGDAEFFELDSGDPLCVFVFDCDGSLVFDACELVPDAVTVTVLETVLAALLTLEDGEIVLPPTFSEPVDVSVCDELGIGDDETKEV